MINKLLGTFFIASAVLLAGAQAETKGPPRFKDHPTDVRFDWNPEEKTVTVTSFTGCLSAHRGRGPESNFKVWFDRDYLQFDIQGGYRFKLLTRTKDKFRIGSADCMGSRSKSVSFTEVEPETYLVNRYGKEAKTIELGDEEISFIIRDEIYKPRKKVGLPHMFLTAD